jgi:hypothetical protein
MYATTRKTQARTHGYKYSITLTNCSLLYFVGNILKSSTLIKINILTEVQTYYIKTFKNMLICAIEKCRYNKIFRNKVKLSEEHCA